MYAQLVGTKVDYGIARSTAFGSSRFGVDYGPKGPLVPRFSVDPTVKINMIGHSMGGPTIRMFVHLMRYGNQSEVDAAIASNAVVSPLFWTNKTSSSVTSVFTIS